MHLTSSPLDWYAARAGGVVAYVLLSLVVGLGLTMSSRTTLRRWPRFAVEDVHRFAGLLVGAFVALHVATIAIDSYLPFSLTSLAVPLVSIYRPVWVALGIVAAELLLALAVTNRYRERLPYAFWRRAHYLNFTVWTAATLHGLGSGTDRSAPWLLAIYTAAVAGVAGTIVWRFARKPALGGLAAAGAAATVLALATGPFAFHPVWNAATFTDTLSGRILRQSGPSRGIVSMAGQGRGRQRVLVRADLLISPGRLDATSFQMEFLPSGAVCTGSVTAVRRLGFDASCQAPDGLVHFIHAQWGMSNSPEFDGGVLSARV